MTSGPNRDPDFVTGFLDDYFAESEEHLTTVRRVLLALEDSVGNAGEESALLEELFRTFHSLKGISAMVDLRDAERLAHELESYLRALRADESALTSDALSALSTTASTLESVIEAKRTGGPPPSIEAAIQTLARVAGALPVASAGSAPRQAAGAAPATWRFMFTPSRALVDRGVKVDTIRGRLASLGRLVSVAPKVTAGGGMAFEFLVSGAFDPASLDAWREDGLTWEPLKSGGPDAAADTAANAPADGHAGAATGHAMLAPSHLVRVDLKRLDQVMRRVADLVVARARVAEGVARVERLLPAQDARELQEHLLAFERQLRDLREDVMRVRLVRVDEIFRRMPLVARDLARETGKDVRVELHGQLTEIDKYLVERMLDPVLHLVRNAVSHGLERSEVRLRAGKPAQGVITLRASTSGEMVLLDIADDGAGIDAGSVAARARASGLRVPDGPLDSRVLLDLLCEAGFSTRDEADRASGRGMGLSVVRTVVQELGGTLTLDTAPGTGTRFLITLPLTLAVTDALIARAGGQRFAIPQSAVQEVIEIDASAIRSLENNELVPHRGRSLPLLRLSTLFHLPADTSPRLHGFVVGTGQDAVAIGVQRILGQREVVVRSLADSLLKIDGLSGATELGDGQVVLIVDVAALTRRKRTYHGAIT